MLVLCPQCGRKVSDRAPVCPFCRAARGVAPRSALLSAARISAGGEAGSRPGQSAPPPPPSGPLAPGASIGSDIQVLKLLGEGGFGLVYLARSSRIGFCAVKTLRDELAADERVVDLFQKEARIWIELERHPYLVRAFYVDEVNARLFVAMEYIPPNDRGINDLEGYLRRQLPDLGQTLWWGVEFCHGMEYASSRGVRCHRDIKPANILIGPDNRIRITDFGIAGVILARSGAASAGSPDPAGPEGATRAGTVFGTPTHMPPEQFVDAARCDARSDVYSFGAVLFQMVSGRLPFYPPPFPPDGDRNLKIWSAFARLHREEPVPRLDSPLSPIIARCMEKDPAGRYPSFAALRADLEALLAEKTGETVAVPAPRALEAMDWSNKGMSFAALGDDQEALRCYDRALAVDPDSAPTYNNKGNALSRFGRRQEAIACFDRAIALDPKYAAPHSNKGIALVWLNRYAEALACFEAALSLDPRAVDTWVSKGVVLGRLGREAEALACYERALVIDPGDPIAWYNKAGNFHAHGRREEALECIERALRTDPRYVMAWVTKGVLLGDLGRHEEALQAFDRALVLDPRFGKSWYNKGNVYVGLGRFEDARQCFERATALDPGFPVGWYNRALAEVKLARYDEARASLRQFLSAAPPGDEHRAGAQSMLEALDRGERIVLGSLNVGDTVLTEEGSSEPGVKVPVQPAKPPAPSKAEELARLQERLKAKDLSTAELLEITRRVEELTPRAGALLNAVFGQRGGAEKPASPHSEPADSPTPDQCLERAVLTYNQKQFEKAISWYDRALAADPDRAEAWVGRAESLRCLKRFEEALSSYDRALAKNPGDAKVWMGRGMALGGLGRHGEAAASLAKALEMEPSNLTAWNLRGAALLAAGRAEDALHCFEQALAKDSRYAIARFNLARAEEKLGRRSEAARSFQQFLSLAPPSLGPQIQQARARLAELRRS